LTRILLDVNLVLDVLLDRAGLLGEGIRNQLESLEIMAASAGGFYPHGPRLVELQDIAGLAAIHTQV